jgi:hypothetical protein
VPEASSPVRAFLGFSALYRALRAGVPLPAAALVTLASALRGQFDQGE